MSYMTQNILEIFYPCHQNIHKKIPSNSSSQDNVVAFDVGVSIMVRFHVFHPPTIQLQLFWSNYE
jgi:hypothetical protein